MDNMEKIWCNNFSGPILYHYVWWILYEAIRRNLHTLYFLARDGYVLCKIAELFCVKYNLPVSCRYLYCSRASLRMPSYNYIGEEAIELLTLDGYYISMHSILDRLHLTEVQRQQIYQEIGFSDLNNEDQLLTRNELKRIKELLKNSYTYRSCVKEKSQEAYPLTIGYLKQEGLFNGPEVAIVDSGWTGSMQRSLRQLMQAEGYTGQIIGFYFGMYAMPKEQCDGTYLTWYFNKKSNLFYKIPFCNNLFECMLSAPHGMTVSYQIYNGKYEPVLKECYQDDQMSMIKQQIHYILNYTKSMLEKNDFWGFNKKKALHKTYQLVKRYMGHPKKEEVEIYGKFLFCDDTTESYHMKLAAPEQISILKNYLITTRIKKRILMSSQEREEPRLFWLYGTIAYLPGWKRNLYRWNIYLWEFIRYVLR